MNINFQGLVDLHTLPTTEPLLPLYEAVVNSIQSINQANITNGNIYIEIEREDSLSLIERENWETDIENIVIHDNGIGFTEDNFKSFNTYASDFKKMLGCKGVGRMIWLKAFDSVKVESTYCEDGNWFHRTFTFDRVNAVSNELRARIEGDAYNSTIITLQSLRSKNKSNTPKKISTIARDLLNHCFIYFVLGKAPKITISDGTESISVNGLFEKNRKEDISTVEFSIEDKSFKLIHFKNYNPNSSIHCINLCANDRRVSSTNLQSVFSGVNSKFVNTDGSFVYNGYITSDYLDENVNRERTAFNIDETQRSLFSQVTKSEIVSKATELVFASELVGSGKNSEMDALIDMWINTVYNDPQVKGSEAAPVVYMRNGTGSPLIGYAELAERWGISKATVGRYMRKLSDLGYVNIMTYPGTHGSVISLQGYMSTMFQVSDVMVDKEEIAMSLCIKLKSHEIVEEIEVDSVSKSANSVSKLNVEILLARIISFINAQGFSCSECGRMQYMLLELSDCKEDIKSNIKFITEDKKYKLIITCGGKQTIFVFECCLRRKEAKPDEKKIE